MSVHVGTSVVLRCVLLPAVEEAALRGGGGERGDESEGARLDEELRALALSEEVDLLQVAFFPSSSLEALGLAATTGREDALVRVESELGLVLCVRPRLLPDSLAALVQQCAYDFSMDRDALPFLYPCSSLRLLPGRPHRVSRVPALPFVPVKTITLLRLVGQPYASEKRMEDAALQAWFSQKRVVRLADVTPVPQPQRNCDMNYHNLGALVSWYRIHAIHTDEEGLVEDSDERIFVCNPDYTTVLLNECSIAPIFANLELQVTVSIYGPCDLAVDDPLHRPLHAGTTHGAVSLSKLYQHLEWCARLPLPAVAGISIVSRPSSTPSSYLQGIHPTTATARAYGAAVVQTMSSSDILSELARFAKEQQLKLFQVDYRYFLYAAWEYLTKRSVDLPILDPNIFSLRSDNFRHPCLPSMLSPSSAKWALDDLVTFTKSVACCVICITDLDANLDIEASVAVKLKRVADNKLCDFIHSLFSQSGRRAAVTAIGTTSAPLSQLSPEVLEQFPQHLIESADLSFAKCLDDCGAAEAPIFRAACLDNSDLLGRTHMNHFVQELRLSILQRSCGSAWKKEAFGLPTESHGWDLPHIEPLSTDDVTRVQSTSKLAQWGVRQASSVNTMDKTSEVLSGKDLTNVHWDDIGGVESVRNELIDTLLVATHCTEGSLRSRKRPRRTGVLLYGPPGTGKTLIAKAVACECGMAFLSVKGPELLDMYIGESERRVRALFEKARAAQPCVLFFDELDSLAPARGGQSSGGGASGVLDRVVSQLLIELDDLGNMDGKDASGVKSDRNASIVGIPTEGVFVIGATNRPDLLDTALMRPGRFDKKIFLGPCESHEGKIKILSAQTKNYSLLDRNTTLELVAELLHNRPTTGAELGAIVSTAYEVALHRKIRHLEEASQSLLSSQFENVVQIDNGFHDNAIYRVADYIEGLAIDDEELSILIEFSDFEEAIRSTKLSISADDYSDYIDQ